MAIKEQQDIAPFVAIQSLRAALADVGLVLLSPSSDSASPALRLIELGRSRADVVSRPAEALQRRGHE
ncbi:hypothetical protein ACFY7Z_18215 [Streptomyces sp. NPDC012623]|uniref:hypothetical protein n=1 Tax=unclassified Streptomyces TaxID=2593676 RepID=UPI00367C6BB6